MQDVHAAAHLGLINIHTEASRACAASMRTIHRRSFDVNGLVSSLLVVVDRVWSRSMRVYNRWTGNPVAHHALIHYVRHTRCCRSSLGNLITSVRIIASVGEDLIIVQNRVGCIVDLRATHTLQSTS